MHTHMAKSLAWFKQLFDLKKKKKKKDAFNPLSRCARRREAAATTQLRGINPTEATGSQAAAQTTPANRRAAGARR